MQVEGVYSYFYKLFNLYQPLRNEEEWLAFVRYLVVSYNCLRPAYIKRNHILYINRFLCVITTSTQYSFIIGASICVLLNQLNTIVVWLHKFMSLHQIVGSINFLEKWYRTVRLLGMTSFSALAVAIDLRSTTNKGTNIDWLKHHDISRGSNNRLRVNRFLSNDICHPLI